VFFGAGAMVAAAVAFVLAPTSGKRLRTKIVDLLGAVRASDGAIAAPLDGTTVGQAVAGGAKNISEEGADRPS
jgi:gas vesicle protein